MTGISPTAGVSADSALCADDSGAPGALFHSTQRCNPRFDPKAANAVQSEIFNLMEKAGVAYDPASLSNVSTAVCALIDAAIAKPPPATAAQKAAFEAAPADYFVTICPVSGAAPFTITADCLGGGGTVDPTTCTLGAQKTINLTNSGGTDWTVAGVGNAGWTTSGGVSSNGVQWRGALPQGCPDGVYRNQSSFSIPANQGQPGIATVFVVESCP